MTRGTPPIIFNMIFKLSYPPLLNATYKIGAYGQWYKTNKAKDWETESGWEIKKVWKGKPLTGKLMAGIIFWYKGREPDIDAPIKIVLDVLQKQRVYENDRLITYLTVQKMEDKKNPRIEIQIEKI